MKKIVLFAMVAIVASTFTSCKKDYTCTCTTKETGVPDVVTTVTIKNATKSDAQKACSGNASVSGGGVGISITCSL